MHLLTTFLPVALLAWACWTLQRARRSVHWPRVPATIVESRLVRQGNGSSPRLAFNYLAQARDQVGRRLWVGLGLRTMSLTGTWADGVVARYPVGARVDVAVDPADPGYAVLEPGAKVVHWLLLVVGLFMSAGSVASLVLFR